MLEIEGSSTALLPAGLQNPLEARMWRERKHGQREGKERETESENMVE